MPLSPEHDQQAIDVIRGLAMDAPLAADSGHQGTAMALAPLAHVLYSRVMKFDPADPAWADRDRFVLSNGHASILQYSMLYLTGHGLEMDDLRDFRQWESATPGHPEAGHTAGVEVTTGPLGQGFGNAVGMAIAERVLAGAFGSDAIDHHTYVIAGDGCLMEGVSHEAASLAGHLGLGKLIAVYDDNHITIDGETELAYSDDVPGRFRAYGWDVVELGEIADDLDALEAALHEARAVTDKPSLLVLRTHIGHPSPDHTDDHEAHGLAFDAEDVTRTKAVMGIPDEPFFVHDGLLDTYRSHAGERGADAHSRWRERTADVTDTPEWHAAWNATGVDGWDADLPTYEQGEKLATRKAIQAAFQATEKLMPGLVVGAADLTGNTGTQLAHQSVQSRDQPGGRQIYYGVREHGMGAALVGMAQHGGVLPVGGTFFVFVDYLRPSLRLAALSGAKACFVFTHDSVGVGEDGPTHQPVEQLASIRAIPHLHVVRPADGNETVAAWRDAVRHDGPTALVLSRQGVEVVTDGSAVERGAGIVRDVEDPAVVIVGTGSEVAVCVKAAEQLADDGIAARVVSMPSWDRFDAQDDGYRHSIFPSEVPVLAVEAAAPIGWHRYADDVVGIDRFGASAPGATVLDELGINPQHVATHAGDLVSGQRSEHERSSS
ncbi:MAG: transketolase [Ilumatobacter sp.]|nr:transketolase [Ilumatobacter sp.]